MEVNEIISGDFELLTLHILPADFESMGVYF